MTYITEQAKQQERYPQLMHAQRLFQAALAEPQVVFPQFGYSPNHTHTAALVSSLLSTTGAIGDYGAPTLSIFDQELIRHVQIKEHRARTGFVMRGSYDFNRLRNMRGNHALVPEKPFLDPAEPFLVSRVHAVQAQVLGEPISAEDLYDDLDLRQGAFGQFGRRLGLSTGFDVQHFSGQGSSDFIVTIREPKKPTVAHRWRNIGLFEFEEAHYYLVGMLPNRQPPDERPQNPISLRRLSVAPDSASPVR